MATRISKPQNVPTRVPARHETTEPLRTTTSVLPETATRTDVGTTRLASNDDYGKGTSD